MRAQTHPSSRPAAATPESFQATMEQAAFALKLLPAAAAPLMVVVTPGAAAAAVPLLRRACTHERGSLRPPCSAVPARPRWILDPSGHLLRRASHAATAARHAVPRAYGAGQLPRQPPPQLSRSHRLSNPQLEDEEAATLGGSGPGTVAFVDTAHFVARATSACVFRAGALAAAADAVSQPRRHLGLQKGRNAAPRSLAALSVAVQWRALLRWSWVGARRDARPVRDPAFELWAVGGREEAHSAADRIFLTALTPDEEQRSPRADVAAPSLQLQRRLPDLGAQPPLTLVRTRVSAYVLHTSPAAALILRLDEGFRVRRLSKRRVRAPPPRWNAPLCSAPLTVDPWPRANHR